MGLGLFRKSFKPKDLLVRDFPFKVLVSGYTSFGDDLSLAEMVATDAFGHQHGDCFWDEFNCISGRCHEHPQINKTDYYYVSPDSLPYYGDFFYYRLDTKNLRAEDVRLDQEICGEFTMLFGVDHKHTGTWTTRFVEKTGYDFGDCLFYFQKEEDAMLFCLLLSTYNLTRFKYLGKKKHYTLYNR